MTEIIGMADRDREFADWLNEHSSDKGFLSTEVGREDPFGAFHFEYRDGLIFARLETGVGTYEAVARDGEWCPLKGASVEIGRLRGALEYARFEVERLERRLAELEAADA